MEKLYGYFQGEYQINADIILEISGSYNVFLKNTIENLSEEDIISVRYFAKDKNEVNSSKQSYYGAYLREINGEWQIGEMTNQIFHSKNSPFLKWLTETIKYSYNQQRLKFKNPPFFDPK